MSTKKTISVLELGCSVAGVPVTALSDIKLVTVSNRRPCPSSTNQLVQRSTDTTSTTHSIHTLINSAKSNGSSTAPSPSASATATASEHSTPVSYIMVTTTLATTFTALTPVPSHTSHSSISLYPPLKTGDATTDFTRTKPIPVWAIVITSIVLSLLFLAAMCMLSYRGVLKYKYKHNRPHIHSWKNWATTGQDTLGNGEAVIVEQAAAAPSRCFPSFPGFLNTFWTHVKSRHPESTEGPGLLGSNRTGHTTVEQINNPLAYAYAHHEQRDNDSGGVKRSDTQRSSGSAASKGTTRSGRGIQRGFVPSTAPEDAIDPYDPLSRCHTGGPPV